MQYLFYLFLNVEEWKIVMFSSTIIMLCWIDYSSTVLPVRWQKHHGGHYLPVRFLCNRCNSLWRKSWFCIVKVYLRYWVSVTLPFKSILHVNYSNEKCQFHAVGNFDNYAAVFSFVHVRNNHWTLLVCFVCLFHFHPIFVWLILCLYKMYNKILNIWCK